MKLVRFYDETQILRGMEIALSAPPGQNPVVKDAGIVRPVYDRPTVGDWAHTIFWLAIATALAIAPWFIAAHFIIKYW